MKKRSAAQDLRNKAKVAESPETLGENGRRRASIVRAHRKSLKSNDLGALANVKMKELSSQPTAEGSADEKCNRVLSGLSGSGDSKESSGKSKEREHLAHLRRTKRASTVQSRDSVGLLSSGYGSAQSLLRSRFSLHNMVQAEAHQRRQDQQQNSQGTISLDASNALSRDRGSDLSEQPSRMSILSSGKLEEAN